MPSIHDWNELAAQLGVDSIRCSTAAGSGHPTSSLSAAHLLSVLWSDHLRYDVADPEEPRERPVRALEGPRLAAHVLGAEGRRRHHRRTAPHLSPVRLAGAGASGAAAGDAVDRRRDRFPRPGPADRARDGPGDADRRYRRSRLVSPRRLRGGRGFGLGGDGERLVPRRGQPDRDPRRQSARSARPDDARVGRRGVRGARGRLRMAHRDRGWARRRGDRRRLPRGRGRGSSRDRDREDGEGPRRLVPRERRGLARQGALARGRRTRHRRARRSA